MRKGECSRTSIEILAVADCLLFVATVSFVNERPLRLVIDTASLVQLASQISHSFSGQSDELQSSALPETVHTRSKKDVGMV